MPACGLLAWVARIRAPAAEVPATTKAGNSHASQSARAVDIATYALISSNFSNLTHASESPLEVH